MLGSTRKLMKEVIASNRCICNTASSPPYEITVCHNCLRTLQLWQIMRDLSVLFTYVAVLKAGLQFSLERANSSVFVVFFRFVYLLKFLFVFFFL